MQTIGLEGLGNTRNENRTAHLMNSPDTKNVWIIYLLVIRYFAINWGKDFIWNKAVDALF